MTVIFELVVPNGAQNAQNKCGPNADSEEGCSLMNVYFSAQVMSLWNQFAVHIRKKFSIQIHRTYLRPFPVSSFQYINMFLKLIVEKEDEVVACSQYLCKSDCWCMYRPIMCFLVTEPFSPLYTFFLPDFIFPRKVRSHLKFLQCSCEWLNICPSNVFISPQLINTLVSCSLKPQVPLQFGFCD